MLHRERKTVKSGGAVPCKQFVNRSGGRVSRTRQGFEGDIDARALVMYAENEKEEVVNVEDKESIVKAVEKMKKDGKYPENLWK